MASAALKGGRARADNRGMGQLLSHITATMVLSVAFVLAVILAGLLLWSALRRRARNQRFEETVALGDHFTAYAGGFLTADDLRARLAEASAERVWDALEKAAESLDRHGRAALSATIGGIDPIREERRRLADDSPWRRELAARRLGLLSEPRTRRALRDCLDRGPEIVTYAAALGLARDRDARTLRWVLAHPDKLARRSRAAWFTLIKAFGPGALPALTAALASGVNHPLLERTVLDVLGLGRWTAAVPVVAARLRHADVDVRVAAAKALGSLGVPECAPALLAVLDDKEWAVRAHAARALGRLGVQAALEPLLFRLTDPSWWVRRHAAYALYQLGPRGRDALRDIVEESPDRYARDMAGEALEHGKRHSA